MALSRGLVGLFVFLIITRLRQISHLVVGRSMQEEGHVPLSQRVQPVLAAVELELSREQKILLKHRFLVDLF